MHGEALDQRFYDSCSAATVQIAKAEADPIYALALHNEDVYARDLGGFIGSQQGELMKEAGGMPVTQEVIVDPEIGLHFRPTLG